MSRFNRRQKCYCAFCKSERVLYTKRRINFFNVLACMVGSGAVMLAIWQAFDPRVLMIFIGFLAVAESFVQIRWRLNVVCKHCGFDPVLYLKDASKAAERVKIHLERRKEDPATIFKRPLNLPRITKEQSAQAQAQATASQSESTGPNKGRLVSKQI